MESSVVLIYSLQENTYIPKGSGFFVFDSMLITASHVYNRDRGRFIRIGNEYIKLVMLSDRYLKAPVPTSDDLTICRLPNGLISQAHLHLATAAPATGAACHILGFLPSSDASLGSTYHKLKCVMDSEMKDDPALKMDYKLKLHGMADELKQAKLGGMSGGPIVNRENNVIGMLISRPLTPSLESNLLPGQNIPLYAISSAHIAEVISQLEL